ncbi:MAG: DUF134 domain-containing protein [Promethearchaeota archaeon]
MRHRRGWGGRGRRPKPITLGYTPIPTIFTPIKPDQAPAWVKPPIELNYSELEALRLVDGEGLDQEQTGEKMGVSRGTVWRLVTEGRRKVATALAELHPILITPKVSDKKEVMKETKKLS